MLFRFLPKGNKIKSTIAAALLFVCAPFYYWIKLIKAEIMGEKNPKHNNTTTTAKEKCKEKNTTKKLLLLLLWINFYSNFVRLNFYKVDQVLNIILRHILKLCVLFVLHLYIYVLLLMLASRQKDRQAV